MTQQESNAIDAFIRQHRLMETTPLPIDMMRRKIRRAMTANNFAFILADVVNSFIIDTDSALKPFDKSFSQQTKQNFNQMRKHLIAARKWSERLARPVYENPSTDDMCADSDWWFALIKLVDNRLADDPQKTNLFLDFLLNMPEGDNTYKVTFNDFKLFKP